jgi:hypothetical protein
VNVAVRGLVEAAGRAAARQSLDITVCPYDPGSPDPAEREQARIWVAAYLRARPPALGSVDYSLPEPTGPDGQPPRGHLVGPG